MSDLFRNSITGSRRVYLGLQKLANDHIMYLPQSYNQQLKRIKI